MKMTVEEILEYCKKFGKMASKPEKHVQTFYEKANEKGWVHHENISTAKEKIIKLIEKAGFKKENGINCWWLYDEHENVTYKVTVGIWFNDYYDNAFGQFDYYKMEGKENQHTRRIGEVWFEDGQWKSLTRYGVYTGD